MSDKINLLVIPGVHKGGTTSLYKYLFDNPSVYGPLKKELHFFTPIVYGRETNDTSEYLEYFKGMSSEKYGLDVSPSYLYGGKPLIEALQKVGNAKVILMLRKPSSRFVSFYKQGISTGNVSSKMTLTEFFDQSLSSFETFEKTGNPIENFFDRSLREGCYSLYIEPWIEAFGKDFKVVFFDEFISDPKKVMEEICEFSGIENIYPDYSFTVENKSFKPKSQRLSKLATSLFMANEKFFRRNKKIKSGLKKIYVLFNKTNYTFSNDAEKARLDDFYAPYNKSLCEILEKNNMPKPNW